jgi:hypothetical protein
VPGIVCPPDLGSMFAHLAQRVRALETQQNITISNAAGQTVMQTGAIVQSNGSILGYGTVWYNPATGAMVRFDGVDASGVPRTSFYGPNGAEEVRLGELSTSPAIYGLGVLPYGATGADQLQQVVGSLSVGPPAVTSVNTSSAWVAFGTPNSLSFEVGPSGQFSMTVSGYMATLAANVTALVGYNVDGSAVGDVLTLASGAGAVAASCSQTIINGGYTAGVHTIDLYYQTQGGTADFYIVDLTVTPL